MKIMSFQDIDKLAKDLADSGVTAFKTKAQAITFMMVAQAEGRHPASVARDYHFFNGKHTLTADAMLSRYMESGGKVKWLQYNNDIVEATFSHPRGSEITLSWTQEDADLAELNERASNHPNSPIKKDNWRKYPRAMLRSRLVAEAIRMTYPSVISGMHTPEELQHEYVEKDITPVVTETIEAVTAQTYLQLTKIIDEIEIPKETIYKWCEKENVETLDKISESYACDILSAAKVKFAHILATKTMDEENEHIEIKNEESKAEVLSSDFTGDKRNGD